MHSAMLCHASSFTASRSAFEKFTLCVLRTLDTQGNHDIRASTSAELMPFHPSRAQILVSWPARPHARGNKEMKADRSTQPVPTSESSVEAMVREDDTQIGYINIMQQTRHPIKILVHHLMMALWFPLSPQTGHWSPLRLY
jgi:hypothetical protein